MPIDGHAVPRQLSHSALGPGRVTSFAFTPDGERVVYVASQALDNVFELFVVPVRGGRHPVRLNAPLVDRGDVVEFAIRPDGTRVLYLADQEVDRAYELYSVSIHGGVVSKVNAPLAGRSLGDFIIDPRGQRVVYNGEQESDDVSSSSARRWTEEGLRPS